ncbi:MAG TPA: hypothetical protein VGL03_12650 [Thermoanaerobaculia bacterium]
MTAGVPPPDARASLSPKEWNLAESALRATIEILPLRDGDPPSPTPFVPTEKSSPAEILGCAETLRIPWRRVLLGEIEAEQKLRGYLRDVEAECPFESALTILSLCALRSWRVRDQVETLAWQARTSVRGALKGLRDFFRRLVGQAGPDPDALVRQCRFAYERILLLQRVRRAAARSHGTMAERLAFVCSAARCAFDDAAWALREEDSPRRGHRMEAAVRKVRDEGFLVPRAQTEARSLAELRRIVFASSHSGCGATRRPARRVSEAGRLRLPTVIPRSGATTDPELEHGLGSRSSG